jgi:hypothetical protein
MERIIRFLKSAAYKTARELTKMKAGTPTMGA